MKYKNIVSVFLIFCILMSISGCRGAENTENEENLDSTAVNVTEPQEGSIQVHMAEEYHSLEEFRGYSEEGIFVLCSDAEADTQDNSPEAGIYNNQGLSAADREVIVEESYISVKYDCACQENSFDVWVFTEREGYEEGMRQEIKKMAEDSQPDILDMGEEKEPISYGGLGKIYGNIFGYWAVLEQKLVIVHIEEEEVPYVELVLGHLRWE